MDDAPHNSGSRRRLILTVGAIFYILSFFLIAVWDTKPTPDAISGWYCAGFALGATQDLVRYGWPSRSWIFQYRQFDFFCLLVSGWINPLFLITGLLALPPRGGRIFATLRILLLAMMPLCWVVFVYERFIPREGYLMWTAGMLIVLFSSKLTKLRNNPLNVAATHTMT